MEPDLFPYSMNQDDSDTPSLFPYLLNIVGAVVAAIRRRMVFVSSSG